MAKANLNLPDFADAGEICREYAAICAKDAELRRRREEISAEIRDILARNPRGFGSQSEYNAPSRQDTGKQESPVTKLLGNFAPKKAETPVGASHADMLRSTELSAEGSLIDEALRLLDDQRLMLHRKASHEYCDIIVDKYRPLAADVANAIAALGRAIEEHDVFVAEVQRRNVHASYLMCVERPRWGQIVRWLRSAVEGNHIDARTIPDEWKAKA